MKIYVEELKCYQRLSEEERGHARIKGNTCFCIPDELQEGLQHQLAAYIRHRGETLSLDSMRAELWRMHALGDFLLEKHKDLPSITGLPKEVLIRSLKAWMIRCGYRLTGIHTRLNADNDEIRTSPLILYLGALYSFFTEKEDMPEVERDIWELSKLNFPIRIDPTHVTETINFTRILQDGLRSEAKKAAFVTIRYLAVRTINQQLRGMNRLSAFLYERFPEVNSASDLNRDIIEEYLIYLNTTVTGKKSLRSELASLKSMLDTIALVMEDPRIRELFLSGDITNRGSRPGFKAYSDRELKMWNDAILTLPKQIARALIIHQMLGNRMGETLTLTTDCICERGGHMKVKVFQQKTQTTVYKPASEKALALIKKASAETAGAYGERKYIFVNEKDPDRPMSYSTVQYHLMKMIRQMELRNDNGELYGVGTHLFRHTMGRKLTQMHYDDKTIAQLLGHAGLDSVHRYRAFASKELADETRALRDKQDTVISQLTKEWGQ